MPLRICACVTVCVRVCVCVARRPGVLELMHNLDYCDVLVIGEELDLERESLEIHHSSLLGKHLDATNSTSGISIYGMVDHMSRSTIQPSAAGMFLIISFSLYFTVTLSFIVYPQLKASSHCFTFNIGSQCRTYLKL